MNTERMKMLEMKIQAEKMTADGERGRNKTMTQQN